jgi:hypothetical protein
MRSDAQKDPAVDPNAEHARILLDQVPISFTRPILLKA